MKKLSDYPDGMEYDIETVSAKPASYFSNWSINEAPTCKFAPEYSVDTQIKDGGKRQSVDFRVYKKSK